MRIAFDNNKTCVLFVHSDLTELKKLVKFPGFVKTGPYSSCPLVLPVAHNLVERIKTEFKIVSVDADVQAWLDNEWELAKLPEGFVYHTKPLPFQDIALRFLHTLGSAGLLLDPGMGKSKVVLDYIVLRGFGKVVIVCPKALLFVWEDEIATHRPELGYYTVQSTDWEAEKAGVESARVVIINYTKAVTFKHQLKAIGFDFLHIDEFLIKDHKTTRTEALTEIGRTVKFRCGGSGTLVNNSVLDIFSPIRYLQPSLVGWSFYNFMNKYAVIKKVKQGAGERDVVVAYRKQDEARSILDSCCIVMSKEEWLNLPEKHFHDVYVDMTPLQKDTYDTLRSNFICEVPGDGRTIEVDNPLVMMSKLYQVSNGFLYINDEEEDFDFLAENAGVAPKKAKPRETYFFPDTAKPGALKELTSELGQKRGIIWFNLSAELVLIEKALAETGQTWSVIKGGEKKTGEKVRQFNQDPSIRWLVCQAKSVNYGITVLGSKKGAEGLEGVDPGLVLASFDSKVHTQIFYSLNFSLEVYLQQQDRIHRIGQTEPCDYYRLFTNTSIERKLKEAMDTKMDIRREMLVDIAGRLSKEDPIMV